MPKDLEMLLRTTYFGTIMMLVSRIFVALKVQIESFVAFNTNRTEMKSLHLMSGCQNPALMDHPISLELEVTAPPRSTIKTSGASVSVNSNVKVLVLPPGKAAVQLSSMTMVNINTHVYTIPPEIYNERCIFYLYN